MSAVLGEKALFSQPIPSGFFKRMEEDMFQQFTSMEELEHWKVIDYYYNRGCMENFIGESKQGLDYASVGLRSKIINANWFQLHGLVYIFSNGSVV